jgi:glutamate/tyrosine decarboxylase-like PLP-dependent enzyme
MNATASVPTLEKGKRLELWESVISNIENYVSDVHKERIAPDLNPAKIRELLRDLDFAEPRDPIAAIDFSVKGLWRYQTHNSHPGYFGLFDPAPSTMAIAAEMLVAAFNPQLSVWSQSPFAIEVEQHLLRAFGEKFGYATEEIDGTFTCGGAEANHTAVVTALTHCFPTFAESGLRSLKGDPVVYISAEAHHSVIKAATFCGLGKTAVRMIPVDEHLRMNTRQLSNRIADDKGAGLLPFMVVATAGTTSAGAIDHLEEIAKVVARENLWLHTDAAWGGAIVVVPGLRDLLAGIELSDSITFDPHKLLSTTRGVGMYLTRHRGVLNRAAHVSSAYMPVLRDAGLDVVDPFVHSLQWSRRFIGLKLFLPLLVSGWGGLADAVERQLGLATGLAELLRESQWKVVNDTRLGVVCFVDQVLTEVQPTSYLEAIAAEVKNSGASWLSTTRLSGIGPVLRACVTNHRSSESDIRTLVRALNEAREKVLQEKKEAGKKTG